MDYTKFVVENLRDKIISESKENPEYSFYCPLIDLLDNGLKEDISEKDFKKFYTLTHHILMNVDFDFIQFIYTGITTEHTPDEFTYEKRYIFPQEFLEENFKDIVGEEKFYTYLCLQNFVKNYYFNLLNPNYKYVYFMRQLIGSYLGQINYERFWVHYSCVLQKGPETVCK